MDNAMIAFEEIDNSRAHSWYKKWRAKIHEWLRRNADSDWADILLLLPDLFMFAVGIMTDSRIPIKFRLALLSAVIYVLSPLDIFPEAVLGVPGLIDDAGILIILLDLLLNALTLEPNVLAQVIQEHWQGDDDLVVTIKKLLDRLKAMPGSMFEMLQRLVLRWWPTNRSS